MLSTYSFSASLPRRFSLFGLGLLVACAPTFNWREVRLAQGTVLAAFPCRPDHLERSVPVAGETPVMYLSACEVQGVVFAVAHLEASEPGRVDALLRAWRETALLNMPALTAPGERPLAVGGMTPQPSAWRAVWRARLADGRTRRVTALWVSRGTGVVQATVIGPDQDEVDQVGKLFLDGLQFAM
jgi:hypothetical protein